MKMNGTQEEREEHTMITDDIYGNTHPVRYQTGQKKKSMLKSSLLVAKRNRKNRDIARRIRRGRKLYTEDTDSCKEPENVPSDDFYLIEVPPPQRSTGIFTALSSFLYRILHLWKPDFP